MDVAALDGAALERWFVRIDHWKDCADFDVLRLLTLWYGYQDDLPDPVVAALVARFTSFKYWYTEPTPAGTVDHRWYWSENHRLIFHTIEYLAGQAFPGAVFTSDSATGVEHQARAAARLAAWFDEKARYGFSEWHSDVYYEKDLAPLLTLAEWAADAAVAERAGAFLDLLLFDVALHVHKGNMGVTHGRSYMKEKSRAQDQPVFGAAKVCFEGTDVPWVPDDGDAADLLPRNEGAALLARAARYRPPEVIRRVATHEGTMVDREGMGLALDPAEALTKHPVRADGLSYTDPETVAFWWDRSALTPWQLVPLTLDTMDRHKLWDADLFAAFRAVRDATGGDRDVIRNLAHALSPVVNAGLLTEVDTVTYRSAHVMLSTAQSYRPGCAGYQHHVWQATLDADAVVFTTHPANEPLADPGGFRDLDHYWTGSATLPRTERPRSTPPLLPRIRVPGTPSPRPLRLPRLHACLLPHGALRRGRHRRALEGGAPGRRLRGPVVVAARALAGPRPRRDVHQRPHRPLRPRRRRRGRQRVGRGGGRRLRMCGLSRLPDRRDRCPR